MKNTDDLVPLDGCRCFNDLVVLVPGIVLLLVGGISNVLHTLNLFSRDYRQVYHALCEHNDHLVVRSSRHLATVPLPR